MVSRSVLALGLAGSLAACGPSSAPTPATRRQEDRRNDSLRAGPNGNGNGNNGGGSQRQRQADFLNRLRRADPQFLTIDRAVLNAQNELGLILDRGVKMDDIPPLMKTILIQMARQFPGQDLTVVAYAPSNPPLKIGTARLNARTRDMTYDLEKR